jgi:hypothetical protein
MPQHQQDILVSVHIETEIPLHGHDDCNAGHH